MHNTRTISIQMQWCCIPQDSFTAEKSKKNYFSHSLVTVDLDCDKKTVTWICSTDIKYTERIPASIKAPFSFCVYLTNNSATITALK